MSNKAAALPAFGVKPGIDERELLAAVVDLGVLDTRELAVAVNGQVLRPPIAHAGDVFGEIERGISVTINTNQ
jgi:hypothetical protein